MKKKHEEHQSNLGDMATMIQKTIFRGCKIRLQVWHMQQAAVSIQTCYRAGKGKLNTRRERLLKERYQKQILLEKENFIKKNNKFSNLDKMHTTMGEISCIVSQLQNDLCNECVEVDMDGVVTVNTLPGGWICLVCDYENEKHVERCDLCLKKRPTLNVQGMARAQRVEYQKRSMVRKKKEREEVGSVPVKEKVHNEINPGIVEKKLIVGKKKKKKEKMTTR